jgi:hypothetical protein
MAGILRTVALPPLADVATAGDDRGMNSQPNTVDADLLALPEAPWTTELVTWVSTAESAAVANHSVRSYLFARLLAEHEGVVAGRDFDPLSLFAACVLHDIGLSERGNGHQRFEVDGADLAAEFLTGRGLPAAEVDAVWLAIALHTSGGIAERRGALCLLTRGGVGIDFGRLQGAVTDAQAAVIHRAHPRLELERSLVDVIVAQARDRPEKAPQYSITADLLRERTTPPHSTAMERGAATSCWAH